MKNYYLLLIMLAFCGQLYSQDKLPSFGKIDKADLQMDTCSFDPDADAMYLIDKAEANYNFYSGFVSFEINHWSRIKILKEKGIPYANIKIRYYSRDAFEEIGKLEGYVYNLDSITGKVVTTKLEKTAFFNKAINDNYSNISIAFPDVRVGTVVEYRYNSHRKNTMNWVFQKNIPSRYSEFTAYLPGYFEYTVQTTTRQPFESKTTNDVVPGHIYIMRNIPALKTEPYMSSFKDYLQRVDFQLRAVTQQGGQHTDIMGNWENLTDELLGREIFGGQLKKNIHLDDDLVTQLKATKTELEKMIAVFHYVQKNMNYNNERNFFSPDGIETAWNKKRGSSADINLMLINFLNSAGVNVYPLLVSTKDNGHVNIAYPSLAQFNQVLAYVPIGGKEYFLNAADKYSSYNLMPSDVQSTKGFVIDKNKVLGWINLLDSQKAKNTVSLHANIDESGKVTGEAVVYSSGYGRSIRVSEYKRGLIKGWLSRAGFKTDKVEVKGVDDDDKPLEQKITFTDNLEKSDGYIFLPYNLYLGLVTKNPFTAESRQSDIDFGYLQEYSIVGNYTIPEGFAFEELPKNKQLILSDTSISIKRTVEANSNTVTFNISIRFNRHQYNAEEYPSIKEFYKKMFALLDDKIVVKKK